MHAGGYKICYCLIIERTSILSTHKMLVFARNVGKYFRPYANQFFDEYSNDYLKTDSVDSISIALNKK